MASLTRKTVCTRGLSYLGHGNLIAVKIIKSEEKCLSFFAHADWPTMVSNKPILEIVDHWHLIDTWWNDQECYRSYFRVVLDSGGVITIFHDLKTNKWFSQLFSRFS
jgi:hypothetical protein